MSSSNSSSSSDSNYYKNRPIEFLDENTFFEEKIQKIENKETNFIELPNEDLETNIIESLIEELDAELKKSLDSSLCSSPIVNSNRLNNKCTCQIICHCQCHSDKTHFRFGSNSSSKTSRTSSLFQSNSPSIRRVSFESLEWDISLDLNNTNSSPQDFVHFKSNMIIFTVLVKD